MRAFYRLFSKNPFIPLSVLAEKVLECSQEVPVLLEHFFEGDQEGVREASDRLSQLEHEADELKKQVRDTLPRSLFLQVDRRDFLDVLSALDSVADCAEDVGILFTLRPMEPHDDLMPPLKSLMRRVMATVEKACEIVGQLEVAVEANFTGPESTRILELIDELGRLEHEADVVQDDLARRLFAIEDEIKPGSLFIWGKIFNKIGDMANHSEKMGNRLRLFFAQ